MTAQQQDWLDADDVDAPVFEPVHVPADGPHDVEDLDPEVTLGAGTVDFGAVRVPVPERGTVAVDPSEKGRMQAVHVSVPEGRLSVSALAAPKSSRLWPDLVKEIDASLREGGARVRSFQGDWGRELHATSGGATSLFVGVDGSRWMLYGVATGPTSDAGALDEQLRRMMRGTIVVRGRSPYPVRTVLPLEVPEHLEVSATPAPEAGAAVVELRPPAEPGYRSAPTAAYPAEAAPAPPTTALPTTAPPTTAPPTTAPPTTALPMTTPPTTALPVAGSAASRTSGWSPAGDPSAPGVSSPTTAIPVRRAPSGNAALPVDAAPPTTALPVAPSRGAADRRVSDPDDRPTDIRPAAAVPPPGTRGGSETAPWAVPPPPPSPASSGGGRRRLREPGDHRPVSPGLTGPWAPWPDSPTGSGRAVDPALRSNGPAFPGPVPPADASRAGRRSDTRGPVGPSVGHATRPAPPRTGRPAVRDQAPTEALAAVPEVLRVGRHAIVDPSPAGTGRGAETQPWAAARPAQSRPSESDPVTEPIPVWPPASERPTGRHHRPD